MVNCFNLISDELLKNEEFSKKVFQEIFDNFKLAMKKSMLDYILLCPDERKRLHIELLPRNILCSAQRISREGGFSIILYPDWH